MLTPNEVINYINMNLGVSVQVLEIDEEEILEVIRKVTIPTFSNYYPRYKFVNIGRENLVDNRLLVYRISGDDFTVRDILGVKEIIIDTYTHFTAGSHSINFGFGMNGQMNEDLASMNRIPITWNWFDPNIVEIYPKTFTKDAVFKAEVKLRHKSDFSTIENTLNDDFLELALTDVRRALYPIRYRFQNISSPFGEIQLFMHKLEEAEDYRKEIIERFKGSYYAHHKRRKMWIG